MQPHPHLATPSSDQAWRDILTNPRHTGQTWACVAAAIAHANDAYFYSTTPTSTDEPHRHRQDPLWMHVAVASYGRLLRSGAYQHQAADRPGEFVADHAAITTWLNSPDPRAVTGGATVADLLGIGSDFLLDDDERAGRFARLIEAAHGAGVLRCPDAGVELWHLAGNDGVLTEHRVAVAQHTVIRASEPLELEDLMDETLTGIEAAAAVLTYTADIATRVLTAHPGGTDDTTEQQPQHREMHEPPPRWAQAFPVGTRRDGPDTPGPPAPPHPAPGGYSGQRR